MVFSNLIFLYLFLPANILLYYITKRNAWRNAVLVVFSLFFYAWGEPVWFTLLIFSATIDYFHGRICEKYRGHWQAKAGLLSSLILNLGLLGLFKYSGMLVSTVNALTGLQLPVPQISLPIGISFYTFQCLSYTIDVYRGNVPVQKNPIRFGAYVTLFPQLIAGPIVRYIDVARELENRSHSWENFRYGIRRFLIGLGKKILLADQFALLIKLFRQAPEPSVLFYWMYAIAFMLNIYFDFSGYSDMAIGLGRIFGFHFHENFNYPYLSKSVTEFWRRWHMSLGSWFRDYVYIPMGGNRVSRARWVLNILTVWLLTGLWHGAAWNFVLWGLLFAVLLLIEKWVPALQRLPQLLRHLYVLLLICISFVLFNAETLTQAGADLLGMFGFGGVPLVTWETLYYLRSFAVLLIVGAIGATPVVKRGAERISATAVGAVLEPILLIALLLLCTACLVDGSFSPFLYFRF